jgi:HK97 family phage major capsid protein
MAGFSYATNEHLVRSQLWSSQIKEALLDELFGQQYVNWLTDFPDGDTINIPSIGQAEVKDYLENEAVKYTAMDTGNFTFSINKYKSSATYITNKMKQDSFYANQLISRFVPSQARAIAKAMEIDYMTAGPSGQTASNLNAINGANHRFVASGTNETITVNDFAKAKYALEKANVPMTDLVAIVDPSVGYALETITNLTNISNNPHWEGIVSTGNRTGMRFIINVYGFDVYVSQNLPDVNETINGLTTTAGKANMFFSAASDVKPVMGLLRQAPHVDSEFNKDLQREEYVTTCRYGFKLYRPENLVVVLADTDQV